MKSIRLQLASAAARLIGLVGRLAGKSGTSLPGKVLLRLDPTAIGSLSARIPNGANIVTATNGKTTTCSLASSCLRAGGLEPVHNHAGANMAGGIASALLADRNLAAGERVGLFEVDEFWLTEVASEVQPRAIVISNVFRDQLDRYGELDTIIDRWKLALPELVEAGTKLILCADDPGVASIASAVPQAEVIWFGIDDPTIAIGDLPHSSDSANCRSCGSDLEYAQVTLGHLGHWSCSGCSNRRPSPTFSLKRLVLDGATGSVLEIEDPSGSHTVRLGLPGVYNAYNALAAWTLASFDGVRPGDIQKGLAEATPAFGRAERFEFLGHPAGMLLIKNPTGANEVIRTLSTQSEPLDLLVVLNDRIADGRDVSWIWDADFEDLAGRVNSVVCSGTRASEMALRLAYAGFGRDSLVVEPDAMEGLRRLGEMAEAGIWVLPTYTAMTELRGRLAAEGVVAPV